MTWRQQARINLKPIIFIQSLLFDEITEMKSIINLFLAIILLVQLVKPTVFSSPYLSSNVSGSRLLQPKGNFTMTFQAFKAEHSKSYTSVAEQRYRLQVFYSNLQKLNKHNSNPFRTYNMKPNSFLDITQDQFRGIYTATLPSTNQSRTIAHHFINKNGKNHSFNKVNNKTRILQVNSNNISLLTQIVGGASTIPNINNTTVNETDISLDWTLYAGIIKYQGLCGSCYAFTTADALSAINAINLYSFFVSLSVQQIVDCTNNGLTFGCNGGYLQGAYAYIQVHGITTDSNYPYSSGATGKSNTCQMEGGPFRLSSFKLINQGDCNSIVRSLAFGPISAGISGYNLQFYETGIFNDCNDVLDHAILIVGYRSGMGWKIKNSWGANWGEQGYAWIAENNTCGICNMAVEAIL